MLWTEAAFSECLAWHWQTIIDNAVDEWHERLRACVRAKGGHFEQLLWQYLAIWRETFQFLWNVTQFLHYFWKLPQIRASKFCKLVQQHTEGVMGSIMWVLLEIYFSFQQWKSLENPLKNWQSYRHEFGVLLFWDTVYNILPHQLVW